jgi:ATP/maltotriose-dependent transcriptional regulator MalT
MRVAHTDQPSRRGTGAGYLVVARVLLARERTGNRPCCWTGCMRRQAPGRHAAAMPVIVDPLTSRELEMLMMLAAGRSNQAIASELVVTLDTVKTHVGHILRKLGAANRTEAVARARELSLIP